MFAFTDESGDASLDLGVSNSTSHFVVAASIVRGSDLAIARECAETIRKKYFQSGEMKSSGVGSDDRRRILILKDLSELPVTYYAFVADKREIWKDSGLIFKKPFLKFLSGKVFDRLFRTFPNLDIIADEQGSRSFMDGFKAYVENNHKVTLFDTSTFSFVDSKSDVLVQVSDFIAGSVRRVFDVINGSDNPGAILAPLKGRISAIEEWPPVYHRLTQRVPEVVSHDFDDMVRNYCQTCVLSYMSDYSQDEDCAARVAALIYLADLSRYSDSDRYISAQELLAHLQEIGFEDMNLHAIRSHIIAHFRDNRVVIASNSNGYKIPTKVADISNYVARCGAVVYPMIERLKKAREEMLLMSRNGLDVLAGEESEFLRSAVELISKSKNTSVPGRSVPTLVVSQ